MAWIISHYIIFVVIGIVLLLGLIGYWMDRKKYEQYRQEIVNEEYAANAMSMAPGIDNIAQSIPVMDSTPAVDPANPVQ